MTRLQRCRCLVAMVNRSHEPILCVFKSFIQCLIHLFAGFLKRALRIDGVFHIFDGFVDMLTGLFRRPLFPAGDD
jgi:hypothetical protein